MGEEKEQEKSGLLVKISKDAMSVSLFVAPTAENKYTTRDLFDALSEHNVVYGIDTDAVEAIISEGYYYVDVVVAKGDAPEDGEDGYFEYLFDTNVDLKPKILKDGSVDYKSMGEIPVVEEGQELVVYHPATLATNGKNVLGLEVLGKKGKDLQTLKGKGFVLSEDKTLYKAAITGKATLKGNILEVSNVLVINEDVSTATGGVTFAGDIIIKGNVISGAEVRATGNIEVNGCVEAATLIAGKNVTLKNGMQGNGKGRIHAGKDVSGKFFEQVTIEAKGNVFANAIMHCVVKCEEAVNVAGKFGIIVGGNVSAYREIEATLIGNMNEVKTVLEVGTSVDLHRRLEKIAEKERENHQDLEKLKTANEKVIKMLVEHPDNAELKGMKTNIMRSKIAREASLADLQREKSEVVSIMEKTTNPRIIVLKSIYPGTSICINGVREIIKTENYNVFYQKNGIEIEFMANI